MWLIDVNTYRLVSFNNNKIWLRCPYAILSHTWGEDEVTFQDMQNLKLAQAKTGFWKITQTCKTARNDSLMWAWVDTCCIDKSSSAELQEAINSMFQWYARAVVCYAYLADLSVDERGKTNLVQFRGSRWFTRGWTLQELIAPSRLTFYGSCWGLLGERAEFAVDIADQTGIGKDILQNGISPTYNVCGSTDYGQQLALSWVNIAQRMSWATGRETSRLEDRAYSLLGIFGVNMPLLYGEGSRAFVRLQEEILRQSPDLSLLSWDAVSNLTYSPDPYSDEGHQSLLAPSPDLFSHCGNFATVPSEDLIERAASRVISSIGLKMQLPVIFETEVSSIQASRYDILILLNCSDELDPTRTIVLHARRKKQQHRWNHLRMPQMTTMKRCASSFPASTILCKAILHVASRG